MAIRLFVGNLSYDTTEAALRELFSAVGPLSYVSLPTDRETGKMRGFAFVEFNDRAQADAAIRRFNNELFKGRPLVVNEARARDSGRAPGPPPSRSFSAQGRVEPTVGPAEPTDRGDKPSRNFGPDAPPRGRGGRGKPRPKGDPVPKGPLRQRAGGRFFYDGDDRVQDDDAADVDNFASREDGSESNEDDGPIEL